MATFLDTVTKDMGDAMKRRDMAELSALRMLKAQHREAAVIACDQDPVLRVLHPPAHPQRGCGRVLQRPHRRDDDPSLLETVS